ncbi:RidA family protein [Burkholderia sp. 3C]
MIKRFGSGRRISDAVTFGGVFESSGQVADDMSADIAGQTQQVLDTLDRLLADAGYAKADLTRVQVWLAHIGDFDAMNRVYEAWLADSPKPARACIESKLADPRYLVEMQAFAYRD